MATLRVTIKTTPPLTALATTLKTLTIKVGGPGGNISSSIIQQTVVSVSAAPNNLITKNPDGLHAAVAKPDDISSFTAALDAALTRN